MHICAMWKQLMPFAHYTHTQLRPYAMRGLGNARREIRHSRVCPLVWLLHLLCSVRVSLDICIPALPQHSWKGSFCWYKSSSSSKYIFNDKTDAECRSQFVRCARTLDIPTANVYIDSSAWSGRVVWSFIAFVRSFVRARAQLWQRPEYRSTHFKIPMRICGRGVNQYYNMRVLHTICNSGISILSILHTIRRRRHSTSNEKTLFTTTTTTTEKNPFRTSVSSENPWRNKQEDQYCRRNEIVCVMCGRSARIRERESNNRKNWKWNWKPQNKKKTALNSLNSWTICVRVFLYVVSFEDKFQPTFTSALCARMRVYAVHFSHLIMYVIVM